jgi:hypothetical protein
MKTDEIAGGFVAVGALAAIVFKQYGIGATLMLAGVAVLIVGKCCDVAIQKWRSGTGW